MGIKTIGAIGLGIALLLGCTGGPSRAPYRTGGQTPDGAAGVNFSGIVAPASTAPAPLAAGLGLGLQAEPTSKEAALRDVDAETPGGRLALGPDGAPVRLGTSWVAGDGMAPADRVRSAQSRRGAVEGLFRRAGVPFPPANLLLRAFKQERQVEVWASSENRGRMVPIATYAACAMSGDVGPKRAEGDLQVPEGFYHLQYFWPASAFHISANVGYPNALDRALGGARPGSDIMIHGGCASIGCIAMTDERIEELYVMSRPLLDRGERVHVHIFPGRDIEGLIGSPEYARHRDFWVNLKQGLDFFEKERRAPSVGSDWNGRYTFR